MQIIWSGSTQLWIAAQQLCCNSIDVSQESTADIPQEDVNYHILCFIKSKTSVIAVGPDGML